MQSTLIIFIVLYNLPPVRADIWSDFNCHTFLTLGEEIVENYVDFCLLIADIGFVVSFDRTCMRCPSKLPTKNSHLPSYWGKSRSQGTTSYSDFKNVDWDDIGICDCMSGYTVLLLEHAFPLIVTYAFIKWRIICLVQLAKFVVPEKRMILNILGVACWWRQIPKIQWDIAAPRRVLWVCVLTSVCYCEYLSGRLSKTVPQMWNKLAKEWIHHYILLHKNN